MERRTLRRSAGTVITVWGVGLVAAGLVASPAMAAGKPAAVTTTTAASNVRICHATNSVQNPYSSIEVSISSLDGLGNGAADHLSHTGPVWTTAMVQGDSWGDIIPPIPGVLPNGMNWAGGEAIHASGCVAPPTTTTTAPTTTTTVPPTTTTVPPTTTTVPPTTTTTAPTTTTTNLTFDVVLPTTTTVPGASTTVAPTQGALPVVGAPAEVSEVAPAEALPTEVEGVQLVRQPETLARTGSPTRFLLLVAGLLLALGGLLVAGSTTVPSSRRP